MFGRMGRNRRVADADVPKDACLIGSKSLVANSVYDTEGGFVGKLEEVVIDTRTGCIRHAVLAVGGVLGIGSKRIAVPWGTVEADVERCRYVVDVKTMHLTAVPVPADDLWLQRGYSA